MKFSTRMFEVRSTSLGVSSDVLKKLRASSVRRFWKGRSPNELICNVNDLETKMKAEDKPQTHYECKEARFSSQTNLCEI